MFNISVLISKKKFNQKISKDQNNIYSINKKMNSNAVIVKRLLKQEHGLEKQPIPGVWVKRQGHLNFYFCIHGLDGAYSGGYYFGLLELHENYPFNAPKLFFYTKSGRFQIDMPICTSFTHYHQQTWTSAWNVRTLILATISFMTSSEPSYGCRNDSDQIKKQFAKRSLKSNLKSAKFVELFKEQLQSVKASGKIVAVSEQSDDQEEQAVEELDKGLELQMQEPVEEIFQQVPLVEEIQMNQILDDELGEIIIEKQKPPEPQPLVPVQKKRNPIVRKGKVAISLIIISTIALGGLAYCKFK